METTIEQEPLVDDMADWIVNPLASTGPVTAESDSEDETSPVKKRRVG